MTYTKHKDKPSPFTDEMLDELLQGEDPGSVLENGDLPMELRRRLTERMLNAEMDVHLSHAEESERGNRRNGHNRKTVLTASGPMPIETPRDRQGTFTPRLIPKHARRLPGFDDKALTLFAKGMSTRQIRSTVEELYGIEVSTTLISTVIDEFAAWQNRPLEMTYAMVYLDAIHVKVREAGSVSTRAIHLGIGVGEDGCKEVLGLWLGEAERAKFWLSALQDLHQRGVRDILIAVVDGLTGFPEALETVFPKTTVQTCIVHLLRNSLSSASYRERKTLATALKSIYTATNADAALSALDAFEESDLGMRYPDVVRRWRARWELAIPFLAFSDPIRKVLCTTNAIESLNASVRRAVKVRGHFTSVGAAKKLIFLALREATKKWGSPIQCWGQARRELAIYFGERFDASCGCVSSRGSSEALKGDAK